MNIILFIQKMCLRVRAGQFMRACVCVSVLYIMLSACMCARTYIYMFA